MKNIIPYIFAFLFTCQSVCYANMIMVTDQAGRTVAVAQPVKRVVTTFIPATIFALSAGLGNVLVGASNKDITSSIYQALVDPKHPPVLVGNRTVGLSFETIFSLKPDLVIMYGQEDGIRLADRLTSLGIPAIVILPESITKMTETLDIIGTASERKPHTNKVVRALENIQEMMLKKCSNADRYKVYYATNQILCTVSGDMLQNEMIDLAGGRNVSAGTHGFFMTINQEQLLSWNPDIIIASERLGQDALERIWSPEFAIIQAVKKRQVFRVPAETYWDFPSPLAMAGVLWMSSQIHPDIFPKNEIRSEIDALYDTIFGKGFSQKHPKVVGKK